MADFLSLLATGIPAIAIAAFALYLLYNRGQLTFLKGRDADLLIGALLLVLAGQLGLLVGLTIPDATLATGGWFFIGVGLAMACFTGIRLIQYFEGEQRKQVEALNSASANRARVDAIASAAEATGIGLLLVERGQGGAGRVIFGNRPAATLLGRDEQHLAGLPLESVVVRDDHEALVRLEARARSRPGEPLLASLTLLPAHAGGEPVPVEFGITYQPEGERPSYAVTLLDARPKRTAIAAAREARSDADFYLDLVTHDLSNFNQGALGYLELIDLNKDAPVEKVHRFEANALRQIRNSARLIENVKLLSVIRDTREPLAPVDALYALHDAIDHVVFTWTEKDVQVRLVPTTALHIVRGDGWLTDLFAHLLDNAVKFSAGTRVEIAVSVAEAAGGDALVFRIADEGRGISPEEREVILDRLTSRKRDYSAYRSGIGLFIVKTIADRYGARLWIEDRVPGEHGKGSVFCLEIPSD